MAMRQAAGEGEGILPGGDDGAALEHATQAFDVRGRPVGEVAQRAFAHFALVAVALAQQDGGGRVPVRDGFDIHGRSRIDLAAWYKSQTRYYMATNLDGLRQFFQDFRQFIVTASRKLGLEPVWLDCGPNPSPAPQMLRLRTAGSDGSYALVNGRRSAKVI